VLHEGARVRLRIYDAQGRQVRDLVDGAREAGAWTAAWDGRTEDGQEAASGVYLYRGEAGPVRWSGKVVLLR
jgi:flagellar hook assembly protein FlgD